MPEIKVTNTKFDPKYVVFKVEDAHKYWTPREQELANILMRKLMLGRQKDGKSCSNNYLVVNTNEVYASEVAEIMKEHGHYKEILVEE